MKKELSIILPVFNEKDSLPIMVRLLNASIKFKKEIINSDLLANLKNNFGEDIDEDKIMVVDHEEWK